VTRFPSRLVRRPGVAPNAAAPEAPEFLMATPHTPKADLGLVRGARQFGRHRPRAAAGAFLEQGLGFDHSNRLLSEPCSLLARRCFGPVLVRIGLVRFVVADGAPGGRAQLAVAGHVTGDSADDRCRFAGNVSC
jgi:hypothetical protein